MVHIDVVAPVGTLPPTDVLQSLGLPQAIVPTATSTAGSQDHIVRDVEDLHNDVRTARRNLQDVQRDSARLEAITRDLQLSIRIAKRTLGDLASKNGIVSEAVKSALEIDLDEPLASSEAPSPVDNASFGVPSKQEIDALEQHKETVRCRRRLARRIELRREDIAVARKRIDTILKQGGDTMLSSTSTMKRLQAMLDAINEETRELCARGRQANQNLENLRRANNL